MSLTERISSAVQGTVRYKLLVLVLFPILLVMPVTLAIAVYWGINFTYDQFFIKVSTDLSVANDVFRRKQQDYLDTLGTLAESYAFRTALEVSNDAGIRDQLKAVKSSAGFSYLNVFDRSSLSANEYDSAVTRWRSSSSVLNASQ